MILTFDSEEGLTSLPPRYQLILKILSLELAPIQVLQELLQKIRIDLTSRILFKRKSVTIIILKKIKITNLLNLNPAYAIWFNIKYRYENIGMRKLLKRKKPL